MLVYLNCAIAYLVHACSDNVAFLCLIVSIQALCFRQNIALRIQSVINLFFMYFLKQLLFTECNSLQ